MASIWDRAICLSIFGESHGPGIGAVLDRLPAGEAIDMQKVLTFMARRAPGKGKAGSTARTEADTPEILSGILNGKTTGAPLCAVIRNTNQHSQDYGNIQTLARPGHADYTGYVRYKGCNDVRGGGHFSGRLTAPMVFAGAVCGQILEHHGIHTAAHISVLHGVTDRPFNSVCPDIKEMVSVQGKPFPVLDDLQGEKMRQQIEQARLTQDSVGGVIECITTGVPAGVGSPMFEGVENDLASIVMGIPAVRGIEFGAGFAAAEMTGSSHNDPFIEENGVVRTTSNNHGGILGGITSGMPILFRVCIKPTASISQPQHTVDYQNGGNGELVIKGRHDACILPRAVPVVEAAAHIAILSQMVQHGKIG